MRDRVLIPLPEKGTLTDYFRSGSKLFLGHTQLVSTLSYAGMNGVRIVPCRGCWTSTGCWSVRFLLRGRIEFKY